MSDGQISFMTVGKINISKHLEDRLLKSDVTGIAYSDESERALLNEAKSDFLVYLKLAKLQYENSDNKWIFSLANFTQKQGSTLLREKEYSDAITYLADSVRLYLAEQQKLASSFEKTELVRDINASLKNVAKLLIISLFSDTIQRSGSLSCDRAKRHLNKPILRLLSSALHRELDAYLESGYIKAISGFPHSVSTDLIEELFQSCLSKDRTTQNAVRRLTNERFKLVRGEVLGKWTPGLERKEKSGLDDLIRLREISCSLAEAVGDQVNHMIDMADLKRLQAYGSDNVEEAVSLFDESIEILDKLMSLDLEPTTMKRVERELLFTKARRFEILASERGLDTSRQIRALEKAEQIYAQLHDWRSYITEFMIRCLDCREAIESDLAGAIRKAKLALQACRSESLQKLPDLRRTHILMQIISRWPLGNDCEENIKSLCDDHERISQEDPIIRQAFSIVLSYNLLVSTMGKVTKSIDSYFRRLVASLVKKEKVDIAEITSHLHFIEEPVRPEFVEELLAEEGQRLEFKGSFQLDIKCFLSTGKREFLKQLGDETLKTVVGFLNASGGTLVLGVLEHARYKGLARDLPIQGNKFLFGVQHEYTKLGHDGFLRGLQDKIRSRIDRNVPALIEFEKVILKGQHLLRLNIPKGQRWYFLDGKFYAREGNQTVIKEGPALVEYVSNNPR